MVHAKNNPKPEFLAPFPEIYTPCEIQNKSRDEYIQGKKTGTVLTVLDSRTPCKLQE